MKENKKVRGGVLLVLPVLVLPFLTFAFWGLGGGRSSGENAEKTAGINAELPDAKPGDDSALDKMAFYDQAEKAAGKEDTDSLGAVTDSLDRRLGTDPFDGGLGSSNYSGNGMSNYRTDGGMSGGSEARIRQRMQELQQQLEADSERDYPGEEFPHTSRLNSPLTNGNTTALPELVSATDTTDAEMEQLQSMMNRIYDIQHPDEVTTRLKAASEKNRGIVYPVTTTKPENTIHFLSAGRSDSSQPIIPAPSRFYGLPAGNNTAPEIDKGIWAVTQQDQILVNGATLKLRLQQDIYVNGLLVPQGTFVTGQVQLSNDRLQVEVMSLLSGQNLLQVKLAAYDTDGMEGLNIPGSISLDVVRQSGDNTLQGIGVGTLDPSIGAQAAAAGIETAKTLFSRKLKLTKIFVKAGHRVLLKNQ